jgi:hypothetical protein
VAPHDLWSTTLGSIPGCTAPTDNAPLLHASATQIHRMVDPAIAQYMRYSSPSGCATFSQLMRSHCQPMRFLTSHFTYCHLMRFLTQFLWGSASGVTASNAKSTTSNPDSRMSCHEIRAYSVIPTQVRAYSDKKLKMTSIRARSPGQGSGLQPRCQHKATVPKAVRPRTFGFAARVTPFCNNLSIVDPSPIMSTVRSSW